MKILHCVYGMNRGGLETFIMNLFRNIDRNKIGFDFLVHTDQECAYDREIKELGGKIYFVPPRKQGVNANRLALRDFFECHPEYQIVHQHVSSLSYIEPLKVAKEKGIPVRIVHGHSTGQGGNYLHRFAHVWNRLHIRNFATHFFACSDLAANWMFGKRYHASGDVQIINNGIPVESFTFDERKRVRKRKELGIEGKFVVGHIGRFAEVKNHDFLVEIFRAVHRLDSNSVLLLVGDGDLRIKTEEKVRLLGLSNNVIFTGLRSDIPELLCAMDVFVLPSVEPTEAFGLVQLEAMAYGKPVINTLLPTGVPFVSIDGKTGLTVEPRNSKALADAINKLLSDDELRKKFGIQARNRVVENFTVDKMNEKILKVYQELMY